MSNVQTHFMKVLLTPEDPASKGNGHLQTISLYLWQNKTVYILTYYIKKTLQIQKGYRTNNCEMTIMSESVMGARGALQCEMDIGIRLRLPSPGIRWERREKKVGASGESRQKWTKIIKIFLNFATFREKYLQIWRKNRTQLFRCNKRGS